MPERENSGTTPCPDGQKPDDRQARLARRLARFRLWVMLGTGALVAAAFLLVLTWQVPPPRIPLETGSADTTVWSSATTVTQDSAARKPARETPVDAAVRLHGRIESTAAVAAERWTRARLLLAAVADTGRMADQLLDARRAVGLGESSAAALRSLDPDLAAFAAMASAAPPGSGFRIKAFGSAAGAYARELAEDAALHLGYLQATLASLEALAAGDRAESEVKANVANSYLRRSELKQRALQRQRDALGAALRSLVGAAQN